MDYIDALDATITRSQARREILKHNAKWSEFIADHGDHPEYLGVTVLAWLGY